MIFYGKGKVWDAPKKRALCEFTNGVFETKDLRTIGILKKIGFAYDGKEESLEESFASDKADGYIEKNVKELRAIAKHRGIPIPNNSKKSEIINLLREAE